MSHYVNQELTSFVVRREQSDELEFVIIGSGLTALRLNQLMYDVARNSGNSKLNTVDLIMDWSSLYSDGSNEGRNRLERHRKMPGWEAFEQSKDRIFELITRNYDPQTERYTQVEDSDDVLYPVIHGVRGNDGRIRLVLGALDDDLLSCLVEYLSVDRDRFDSVIGLSLVAVVSPENSEWPQRSGYGKDAINALKHKQRSREERRQLTEGTMRITTTQILAFACRRVAEAQSRRISSKQDIQQSRRLASFVDYIQAQAVFYNL